MWLEFLDRPINQDYSIYNTLTYSAGVYTASMIEQSRRNPSLFRIFGEHMRTTPITDWSYAASAFVVSKIMTPVIHF